MDPEDHFADLEEENRILRSRLAEAEDKVRRLEEELQIALHRKVEEVSTLSYSHLVSIDPSNKLVGWNA